MVYLEMFFKSGSHDLKEQYIIYDVNSMFADIGGYLGLLLGDRWANNSILSVSLLLIGWLKRRQFLSTVMNFATAQ